MDISIQSQGFSADPKLKSFISERLNKLETFHDKIINVEVYLKLDSHEKIKDKVVDTKLHIPGAVLFASNSSKTFEESTDGTVESLRRQIKKRKEKLVK